MQGSPRSGSRRISDDLRVASEARRDERNIVIHVISLTARWYLFFGREGVSASSLMSRAKGARALDVMLSSQFADLLRHNDEKLASSASLCWLSEVLKLRY